MYTTPGCSSQQVLRTTFPVFQFCSYSSAAKPRFLSGANKINSASDRLPSSGGGLHPANFVADRTRSSCVMVQNTSIPNRVVRNRSARLALCFDGDLQR